MIHIFKIREYSLSWINILKLFKTLMMIVTIEIKNPFSFRVVI